MYTVQQTIRTSDGTQYYDLMSHLKRRMNARLSSPVPKHRLPSDDHFFTLFPRVISSLQCLFAAAVKYTKFADRLHTEL